MEIKISKSARRCLRCEAAFQHEHPMHSAVRIVEGILMREDYCPPCWEQTERGQVYSAWNLRFYDPEVAEQAPPETFSPLRQLFYDAAASEERIEQAKAFLAAQLLRRQKVFRQIKESDEADGEVRICLFADRIGNRLVEVRDPSFSYAEMDAARAALLEGLRALEAGEAAAEPDETSLPNPPEPQAEERNHAAQI